MTTGVTASIDRIARWGLLKGTNYLRGNYPLWKQYSNIEWRREKTCKYECLDSHICRSGDYRLVKVTFLVCRSGHYRWLKCHFWSKAWGTITAGCHNTLKQLGKYLGATLLRSVVVRGTSILEQQALFYYNTLIVFEMWGRECSVSNERDGTFSSKNANWAWLLLLRESCYNWIALVIV